MKSVDLFDLGLDLLPGKLVRILLASGMVLTGGGLVTWYVEQKAVSLQEAMHDVLERVTEDLMPRRSVTVDPPTAV